MKLKYSMGVHQQCNGFMRNRSVFLHAALHFPSEKLVNLVLYWVSVLWYCRSSLDTSKTLEIRDESLEGTLSISNNGNIVKGNRLFLNMCK